MLAHLQHQLVSRWVIAIVGLLIALGGLGYSLSQNENTARQAQKTAQTLVAARAESIFDSCYAQKVHNQKTVKQLQKDVNIAIRLHPTQKALLQANLKQTTELINDLSPVRNCAKLKQQALNPSLNS